MWNLWCFMCYSLSPSEKLGMNSGLNAKSVNEGNNGEKKTSLRILNGIDKITKDSENKDKGNLRQYHTLSEKFPNHIINRNHKLTEYFPVRRSVRKTKKTVMEENQKNIEERILSQREDGLKVCSLLVFCLP